MPVARQVPSRVFANRVKHAMANASVQLTTSPGSPASDIAPQLVLVSQAEWWVKPFGWMALVVFIALPLLTSAFET